MSFIIASVVISLAAAEVINIGLRSMEEKRFALDKIFMDGGMPSRHAALVTALTLGVGVVEGFFSTAFWIALIFSAIVIRDALGVRHNVDRIVAVMNTLLPKKKKLNFTTGHTLSQVCVGTIISAVVVVLLYYFGNFLL